MKTLYWKLAWHGIYKNQKIYLPFLLTSIGITMMYYIVSYLTYSKAIYEMHGGQEMQMILSWGTGVVAIFAAIFLFYMNSFLMRRRKTEFGLYNILGMGKWNIARILCWQNGMLFGTSMVGGLGLGILLSKLSELMAAKMLGNSSPMGFRIEPNAVRNTILLTDSRFQADCPAARGKTGRKAPESPLAADALRIGDAGHCVLLSRDNSTADCCLFDVLSGGGAGHSGNVSAFHLRFCDSVQAVAEE